MQIIKHKFSNYKINSNTETLIVGTFNPETKKNPADFFYGRSRNYMWRLLPFAFDEEDLKKESKQRKLDFIKKYKIDFIDIIAELEVETGEETNYSDDYIDGRVTKWRNVNYELSKLKQLKRVCFTRKTFAKVPNIKRQVEEIEKYCKKNNILFSSLVTSSRFYNTKKQDEWNSFLKFF